MREAMHAIHENRPPVAGMSVEMWTSLRETPVVRSNVVARVRAALEAGYRASADDVAVAMLRGSWGS